MPRAISPAAALAERLCRPQRVGLFGHRGVGKTTLLAVLYREAVAGRLPLLRLAAGDARTANYLSDKIAQLESGQRLPATLAETDLSFHLYHGNRRLELVVKDYQGEHVALDKDEPIKDFFRDCDAVWLCLDAGMLTDPARRLERQQEVEQLIEDYLAAEPGRTMERPVALVLTRADLLRQEGQSPADLAEPLDMVRHALQTHCPRSGLFAVSSLQELHAASFVLQPFGFGEPLVWLAEALQAQDEARLDRLWSLPGASVGLLEQALAAFTQRYPDAPAVTTARQRLREVRRQRRRRWALTGTAAAAVFTGGLLTYDVSGHQQAQNIEAAHPENPAAALRSWQDFRTWHPTRLLLRVSNAETEEHRLQELSLRARVQERDRRLGDLCRAAAVPDADPEPLWQQLRDFLAAGYPDSPPAAEAGRQLQSTLETRRDEKRTRLARGDFDELVSAEAGRNGLETLVERADRFLRTYPGSDPESEVRLRRSAYLFRLDEQAIQPARAFTAQNPLQFQGRREHYQRYLNQHPSGPFRPEAEAALTAIAAAWDRHDFRAVRDHFTAKPGEVAELVNRCRAYLAVHPQGRFTGAATDLLRWTERVTAPGEYRVVLQRGQFESSIARYFSRGPDLAVELEVAGIKYGPSSIVVNRNDPEWNYEFPRRIRWKLGDPVVIRVTDYDWKNRVVVEIASGDDPLGLRLLSGEARSGGNYLTFESDFAVPTLPAVE